MQGGPAPLLFVSVVNPTKANQGWVKGLSAGYVAALDETTLEERWRAPWKDQSEYQRRPRLGVSGDGAFVVAYLANALQVIHGDPRCSSI